MEYPITQAVKGYPGKINLRVSENHLSETFGCPPIAVCLANNHIIDYGKKGFEDTLKTLEGDGVKYFGAGYSRDNCNNPLIVKCGNAKVALLGYVCESTSPVFATGDHPGVLPIDIDKINENMRRARSEGADRVVVSLHWGAEEIYLPKPADVQIARAVIDAGADLIIGHHAHRVQAWEKYKGRYIFYGLGNCLFPDLEAPSRFSEKTGLPTRLVVKKMKYWNKRSLAVAYTPEKNEVRFRKIYFDGKTLEAVSRERIGGDNELEIGVNYARKFRRSFVWGKTKFALVSFLSTPKLPGLRHLKGLVAIANTTQYK
jgi:poly-gamma-glutamate synthesis protein (capsule biosynthesis protein)